MALDATGQADWGTGIVRGREAPTNAFYDAVNALIDDSGRPFRRGGSAMWSTSDAASADVLVGLAVLYLQVVDTSRVMAWGEAIHTFDDTQAPVRVSGAAGNNKPMRPVIVGGVAVFPSGGDFGSDRPGVSPQVLYYGGSIKSGPYNAGTITVTAGSVTVTGAGTSWLANADAGMILSVGAQDLLALVKSIDSDTQLTLAKPWQGTDATGSAYLLRVTAASGNTSLGFASLPAYVAAAGLGGSEAVRLILAIGNRVYFTPFGEPFPQGIDATLYHELPEGTVITGAEGVGDSVLLFSTKGVWRIDNLSLDPVDDAGNIQHVVSQVSKDLTLWSDPGITAWDGQLVVPAVDDVYVMSVDGGARPISAAQDASGRWVEKVRPLYRSYVKAGHQTGVGTVHRGHLFLPILDANAALIDVLVCRLDRGAGWTRWAGHAAGGSYVSRVGEGVRAPKLLSVKGGRVTDLTSTLDPSASSAQDAGDADFDFILETRDFPTSGTNHPGTVVKARLRYELADDGDDESAAPAIELAYSSDQDGGSFTTLSNPILERSGSAGGGVSDGSLYSSWPVGRMRERIRFRITVSGAAGSLVLRTLELLIRQGRLR